MGGTCRERTRALTLTLTLIGLALERARIAENDGDTERVCGNRRYVNAIPRTCFHSAGCFVVSPVRVTGKGSSHDFLAKHWLA